MAETESGYKTSILILCPVVSSPRSHRDIYTIQIKESNIEIINFVILPTITDELAALKSCRGLRLTFYSSFNFRHLCTLASLFGRKLSLQIYDRARLIAPSNSFPPSSASLFNPIYDRAHMMAFVFNLPLSRKSAKQTTMTDLKIEVLLNIFMNNRPVHTNGQ